MLVLSRQVGEQIVIGEGENQIVVVVVEIRGDKTRIGVEAPQTTPVDRWEVRERKLRAA
jgi:carbon storage regulator